MSCRVSAAPLFAGSCVVSAFPGHGIRGDQIPATGGDGASPVFNDLNLPADAAKEYRWELVSITAGWSAQLSEGLTVVVTPPSGTVNGSGVLTYRLYEDAVALPVTTETFIVGSVALGSGQGFVLHLLGALSA